MRHILSLSGGKDSTALAIYMRDRVPEMEYVFCDTGEELPETYEYLERLEAYLGKPIVRLNPDRPFMHYLQLYNGLLPDARSRWCTRKLKIEPFERYVGDDMVYSYIGIRADEPQRKGYISTKPNIVPRYPFVEDGITKADVLRILEESGLGLPDYYRWRSRSGCYFCFFQRRIEWVGLLENHPELFEKAKAFEKVDPETGERFTWNERESLDELARPERMEQIKYAARQADTARPRSISLMDVFSEDDERQGCLICHL
ncbi:MAG: phosphoadenosine phosphosulfate reductase family protein [Fimbriimonadales bacterium]|nr:phosphoadenosine phosphosulfate reductase family protein [Fimbriimonadales bacterium]